MDFNLVRHDRGCIRVTNDDFTIHPQWRLFAMLSVKHGGFFVYIAMCYYDYIIDVMRRAYFHKQFDTLITTVDPSSIVIPSSLFI